MHIYVLIDRSYSMLGRWGEALGAVNAYLKELSGKEGLRDATATVAMFDDVNGIRFDVVRKAVQLWQFHPIESRDGAPRGGTPLYDAIGQLAGLVDIDKPDKASIVIMTDGEENQSKEVSKDGSRKILDSMRGKGFAVVFLGADFDAMKQASDVGTMRAQTLNTSYGNYGAAAMSLAAHTQDYAAKGVDRRHRRRSYRIHGCFGSYRCDGGRCRGQLELRCFLELLRRRLIRAT